MANQIVFDSSALIMLFAKELGYESIRHYMKSAIISSVNIAEVYKYCIEAQNLTEDDCRNLIKLSGIKIIDFCEEGLNYRNGAKANWKPEFQLILDKFRHF